jgi:hypothetical protein
MSEAPNPANRLAPDPVEYNADVRRMAMAPVYTEVANIPKIHEGKLLVVLESADATRFRDLAEAGAKAREPKTADEAKALELLAREIQQAGKDIIARAKALKLPLQQIVKAIDTVLDRAAAPVHEAEAKIKDALAPWYRRLQAEEARKRAEAEAERARLLEQHQAQVRAAEAERQRLAAEHAAAVALAEAKAKAEAEAKAKQAAEEDPFGDLPPPAPVVVVPTVVVPPPPPVAPPPAPVLPPVPAKTKAVVIERTSLQIDLIDETKVPLIVGMHLVRPVDMPEVRKAVHALAAGLSHQQAAEQIKVPGISITVKTSNVYTRA